MFVVILGGIRMIKKPAVTAWNGEGVKGYGEKDGR